MNIRKARLTNYLYLHLMFLFFSVISITIKTASQYSLFSLKFLSLYLIIVFMYLLYAFLWQKILKKFSLVIAYSNRGVIIIWTLVWAVLFFQEKITLANIIGSFIVIFGIVMVANDDK